MSDHGEKLSFLYSSPFDRFLHAKRRLIDCDAHFAGCNKPSWLVSLSLPMIAPALGGWDVRCAGTMVAATPESRAHCLRRDVPRARHAETVLVSPGAGRRTRPRHAALCSSAFWKPSAARLWRLASSPALRPSCSPARWRSAIGAARAAERLSDHEWRRDHGALFVRVPLFRGGRRRALELGCQTEASVRLAL